MSNNNFVQEEPNSHQFIGLSGIATLLESIMYRVVYGHMRASVYGQVAYTKSVQDEIGYLLTGIRNSISAGYELQPPTQTLVKSDNIPPPADEKPIPTMQQLVNAIKSNGFFIAKQNGDFMSDYNDVANPELLYDIAQLCLLQNEAINSLAQQLANHRAKTSPFTDKIGGVKP